MKTFNIGRNVTNDIVLNDKMISRQHAQLIILDNGQVIIKDLGSSNGTFVNGNKIIECNLKAGDIVKCGTTFVKWTQYIAEGVSPVSLVQNLNYIQQTVNPYVNPSEINAGAGNQYSLGETLKYLITKNFSIGDLFKTNWNKTPSSLFFLLTPFVIIFLTLLFVYFKYNDSAIHSNFGNLVILPAIISIFIFGVPQFLTLSLFSINRDTSFNKNIFASSIFSFLQFMLLFVAGMTAIPLLSGIGAGKFGFSNFLSSFIILYLIMLTIVICIEITLIIFTYKYYRVIGVIKGISIHYTVFSFALNFLFQIAFIYFFWAIVMKNVNYLNLNL